MKSLKPLKWYKGLASGKERANSGVFLIEGDRGVEQVVKNQPEAIVEIVVVEGLAVGFRGYQVRYVPASQFKSICTAKTPQGILAVVRLPRYTYSGVLPEDVGNRVLLLEDVQDPGNVGALIRSAVAFGYSGIVMSDKCADPFSPKCVQSTAGTLLSLWIRRTTSYVELIAELKRRGYMIIAADLNGRESPSILSRFDALVLALGNEASGLSESVIAISDYCCNIPIERERAESLNVAACGAICMYLSAEK
ncbi:MAG: RNA methyltransferase [Chloroflexota bacterium]|nr:RNA methyltransferase [Chloroflexota bacterium]